MATTKIWKITGNMYAAIPKVIDYAKIRRKQHLKRIADIRR